MVNVNQQNNVQLIGKIVSIKEVWKSTEHIVYEGILQLIRDSGNVDMIPVLFNDCLPPIEQFISINGQFRSRDVDVNGKLKVELYVYSTSMQLIDSVTYNNSVCIEGYVCKKPTIRTTPSGKQISDVLIACNYGKDKTAYIPVITWGKCARKSGKMDVGTHVSIVGRLQSRQYTKIINNVAENKIAYELSATNIEEVID